MRAGGDDLIDIDNPPEVLIELGGTVQFEDGRPRFLPADSGAWLTALGRLIDEHITVTLARMKKRRSNAANRYLWGVVYMTLLNGFRQIAADAGEAAPFRTKEAVHEAMKHRFLGLDILRLPGGEEMEVPTSTAKLTVQQFTAYWQAIAAWAALRYGIYIPLPNERIAA